MYFVILVENCSSFDSYGVGRTIGALMAAAAPVAVPLALVADASLAVALPIKLGYRLYKRWR